MSPLNMVLAKFSYALALLLTNSHKEFSVAIGHHHFHAVSVGYEVCANHEYKEFFVWLYERGKKSNKLT